MFDFSPRTKRILLPVSVGIISIGLIILMDYWPEATGYKVLDFPRSLLEILSETALVAALIGLLIETTHFGHYFQDKLAAALADLDFLERLTSETLDEIGKKSYRIKNRKRVSNLHHLWEDYFDSAFHSMAALPIRTYRNDFRMEVTIEVLHPEKRKEVGIPGPSKIIKLTKTTKYELLSPTLDQYTHTVEDSMVVYRVDDIPINEIYTCSLLIDGKRVDLEAGRHLNLSEVENKITAKVEYPVTFKGSVMVEITTMNYEDVRGAYFTYYAIHPIKDFRFKFTCRSADGLFSEFWVDKRDRIDYKIDSPQVLQVEYLEWMNPHEGVIVVPRLKS